MKYTSLPLNHLSSFIYLNDITIDGIEIASDVSGKSQDGIEFRKGSGIIATVAHEEHDVLLKIPASLRLSLESVKDFKRLDTGFARIWDAMESFNQGTQGQTVSRKHKGGALVETPRGAILLFLVHQFTKASLETTKQPQQTQGSTPRNGSHPAQGLRIPWSDYMNFLPKCIPLPTFYSDAERDLLAGTSLADALDQKLQSLQWELDMIREATSDIEWCQQYWWNEDGADRTEVQLTLEDWKLADAIYRSRALELPGVGAAMVPILDMANHASGPQWNARFDVSDASTNGEKEIMLIVREGHKVTAGQEVTINYGAGGACEILFSYGFLERETANARELFLSLHMPFDDPLRIPKIRFSSEAPGVRIFEDENGAIRWDSQFVWWACVNEEDGLNFEVVQSNNGQRDLQASWKEKEFEASALRSLLMEDELRDIFVLRAIVLIQQRLEEQGGKLADLSDEDFNARRLHPQIRDNVWTDINKLRSVELDLMSKAYESLDIEKAALLSSDMVSRYLGNENDSPNIVDQDENFS